MHAISKHYTIVAAPFKITSPVCRAWVKNALYNSLVFIIKTKRVKYNFVAYNHDDLVQMA